MLTVEEARRLVIEHAQPKAAERLPLGDTLDLILAEDVTSDIDSPPYDKTMVDGFAVRAADLTDGKAELAVVEEIMAGDVPKKRIEPGCCSRIMTGAPVPEGADAVVMIERTEQKGPDSVLVKISDKRFRTGQNIMRRGAALRRGEQVMAAGRSIRPAEIGLLAEVGRVEVLAIPRPRVAVISTGNELVPPQETPAGGQIRNSNGPMLAAAVRRAGGLPVELGVVRDEPQALRQRLAEGLACDVLAVSGGVSAGDLDLVPGVLVELGVEQVFHKIRVKPGKPLWFGVYERHPNEPKTLVFGLPGNPVSSFVCFELFVRPALARLAGREANIDVSTASARLSAEFVHRGDRPTFHPALLEEARNEKPPAVAALPWAGSGDLRRLAAANALIAFPAGDRTFAAGEIVEVMRLS